MKNTIGNKLSAIALILAGTVPVMLEGDGTALIFFSCIAIPLFFAKEKWIG